MGRARQIASVENMDRILLDASAASTDEGEHLLLDGSAVNTDVGFFINTEIGTTEVPVNNGVSTEHIVTNAVTSTKIVDDAITPDKLDVVSQSMSNRNVIINGAMNVAQRGTSITGIGGAGGQVYTLDRFGIFDGNTAGRITVAQQAITDLPGFQNALKVSCTTADTSVAAGEILTLNQRVEGQNLQRFKKGTSEARSFVLSFFCKANAPATYVAELFDVDNSRHVGRTFQVGTTFSRVEINFGTDTTGAFDDDANRSLDVSIFLHAGTSFTAAGTLQTTWGGEDTDARAVGADSIVSSTDNTFFITGVQLEAGDTAGTSNPTEFEHDFSFGDTLLKCERYYMRTGINGSNGAIASGYVHTSSETRYSLRMRQEMRSAPGIGFLNVSDFFLQDRSANRTPSGLGGAAGKDFMLVTGATSGANTGEGSNLLSGGSSEVQLNSEL